MKILMNKLRTLLNGGTLIKNRLCTRSKSIEEGSVNYLVPQNDGNFFIAPDVVAKGLCNLDNPVLRGSFNLVLNQEILNSLDTIAKKAFNAVISNSLYKIDNSVSTSNPTLKTIHLETDLGKVQNRRPGVYIIQHKESGYCIVGQTKDLRKRFNQYTSRSKHSSLTTTNNLNRKFHEAAQKIPPNIDYSQVFQRYVVYTWVDENKQAVKIDDSLQLKNEMNYLEHRLILAFFAMGLVYNIEDVSPRLTQNVGLINNIETSIDLVRPNAAQTGHQPKPFKMNNMNFLSSAQYEKYRKSIDKEVRKSFLAMPNLRKKLTDCNQDLELQTRYLTREEIEHCKNNNLFYNPDKE